MRLSTIAPILAVSMAACMRNPTPTERPSLRLEVAALELPQVTDACYTLAVRDEAGATVWQEANVCASSYGRGGDITFVGACDATDGPDADTVATNSVRLIVESVASLGGTLDDFINPCKAPDGCVQSAICKENEDTAVTFNLTFMRQANQGFFDIGVSFQDIFCSAKVDCRRSDGTPLMLLHHPVTQARAQTAVVALACTAGPGATPTRLLRDFVEVTCDGYNVPLNPARGDGQAYGSGPGQIPDPDLTDPVWQYAIYSGSESLDCGGASCQKQYWNVAIGFDTTARNCHLSALATALDGAGAAFSTPAHTLYPLISYEVGLTTDAVSPALACQNHPLNGAPSGVSTTWSKFEPVAFPFAFDGLAFGLSSVDRARVTSAPSAAVAGVAWSTPVTVVLEKTDGTLLTTARDVTVAAMSDPLCTTPAPGTLIASPNPVSTSTGTASFSGVTYTAGGTIYLKASSDGLVAGCSGPIAVTAVGPSLAFVTPTTWPAAKGGVSLPISVSLTTNNATSTSTLVTLLSTDGGVTWSPLGSTAIGSGPWTGVTRDVSPTLPSSDVANAKIRVEFTDRAGGKATVTSPSFAIDVTPPALGAGQMSINGGATTTLSSFVKVSLRAADTTTPITHFCLKLSSIAPGAADSCWTSVTSNPPGLLASSSLILTDFPFTLGFTPTDYSVHAWVRDAAGWTSTLTGVAGTEGTDKATISLVPADSPTLGAVLAANSDGAVTPLSPSQLSAALGQDVFVQWRLEEGSYAFGASPIKIEYTTDDVNFTTVAAALSSGVNGSCTVSSPRTGCYRWAAGAPTSSYFRVKVTVTDSGGLGNFAYSEGFNSNTTVLAGNTDPGTDGPAAAAIFVNQLYSDTNHDLGTLAVASDGVLYFRDRNRGILRVNPADGIQRIYIPTTGSSTGDGGPATSATLKWPIRIELDAHDNLYIFDYDRVRRVDAVTGTITRLIGGGSGTTDGTSGTNFLITPPAALKTPSPRTTLVALPDGDVLFSHTTPGGSVNTVKRYSASTGTVSTVNFGGTGTNANPTLAVGVAPSTVYSITPLYDPGTSVISRYYGAVNYYQAAFFSPAGVSEGTGPTTTTRDDLLFVRTGLDGKLYASVRWGAGTNWYHIMRYEPTTNAWVKLVGTGSPGQCSDGSTPLGCALNHQDFFVTAAGRVYFMDNGRVRTIDPATNLIVTLYGAPFTAGDGGPAVAARFGRIDRLRTWNDGTQDRVIALDWNQIRLREFRIDGSITTIAGTGTAGYPSQTAAADTQPIQLTATHSNFTVDASGAVYAIQYGDVGGGSRINISRLNRTTNRWVVVLGSISGADPTLSSSVGLAGTALTLGYSYTAAPNIYQMFILGGSSTELILGVNKFITAPESDRILRISHASGTLNQRIGLDSPGTLSIAFCNDGTLLDGACGVRSFYSWNGLMADAQDDVSNSRVLITEGAAGLTNRIRILPKGASAVMGTLVASLPRNLTSFVYLEPAGIPTLYYCGVSGSKYGMYRYVIGTATETALSLGLGGAECRGETILHLPARNSLIFPFERDGINGVMEYRL